MAAFQEGPALDFCHGHKREQSQDSGAYIDWSSEDSASPTGNADGHVNGEFVTVVAVEGDGTDRLKHESPFVTVLAIGDEKPKEARRAGPNGEISEDVLVYRLPGERLGFGLKFEGGTNTAENVKRLFIQSSAPDSPASRAECSWGSLVEGDEILRIDDRPVKDMTRLDCVRCLKESSVVIKLHVRHPVQNETDQMPDHRSKDRQNAAPSTTPTVVCAEMKKRTPPPPPIPPRKIPRKSPAPPPKDELPTVDPPEGFCDGEQISGPVPRARSFQSTTQDDGADKNKNQTKAGVRVAQKNKQDSPDVTKRKVKRKNLDLCHVPPEPEVYLDLLAQEDVKNNGESESDDTGSTISTVVGFSSVPTTTNSSFSDLRSSASSICDSTTPSTPTSTPTTPVLDLSKILSPYENSETNGYLFTKLINDKEHDTISYDEKISTCSDEVTPLQPPLSFQDAPLSYGNEEVRATLAENMDNYQDEIFLSSLKNYPEDALDEVDLSGNDNKIKESQQPPSAKSAAPVKKSSLIPRLAKSIGLLSPPKPSPRKDPNGSGETSKSRSNKKRPPPPPPPRSDRPQCPQPEVPENKTLKSSIPYLKRKKSKHEEEKKSAKLDKKQKNSNKTEEKIVERCQSPRFDETAIKLSASDENLTCEEEPESAENDQKLCWPVPDLKTSKQNNDSLFGSNNLPNGGNSGSAVTDEFLSESVNMEFGVEAVTSREPYFLFQWSGSKQLETIGEDEEDVSNEEGPEGSLSKDDKGAKIPEMVICGDDVLEMEESATEKKQNSLEPSSADSKKETVMEFSDFRIWASVESDPEEKAETVEKEIGQIVNTSEDTRTEQEKVESGNESSTSTENEKPEKADGEMKKAMVPVVPTTIGLAPPPSFSRMPPDGHEFPQNYQEESVTMPAKVKNGQTPLIYSDSFKTEAPPLPASEPPPSKYSFRADADPEILPGRKHAYGNFPDESPVTKTSRTSHWRQDEKSGKSVRDKIAMFSSVPDQPVSPANNFGSGKLSKYKSSEDVFYDDEADCVRNLPDSKLFSRSVVSVDKIGNLNCSNQIYLRKNSYGEASTTPRSLDFSTRTQSSTDLTSSSSSAYSSSCSPDSSLSSTTSSYLGYSSTLPRKNCRNEGSRNESDRKSSDASRTASFSAHGRSQSLLDVQSPYGSKFKTEASPEEDQKHSSLHLLVEQRRKNLSKLRGLVIPEKSSETPPSQPIFDLPEIKSRDSILASSKLSSNFKEDVRLGYNSHSKVGNASAQFNSPTNLTSPPWKTQNRSPNIPKYSPAFKRKTISVYGSSTPVNNPKPLEILTNERLKPPCKPPRTAIQCSRTETFVNGNKKSLDYLEEKNNRDFYKIGTKSSVNVNGKYRSLSDAVRSEEDSDNDSAVSSSRSSTSHGYSPPTSPLLDNHRSHFLLSCEKSPVTRTLSSETTASGVSNTSTLTSGSQASCNSSSSSSSSSSDGNNKRVLKAQSLEAINRKNVLASAKYSRGFDAKSGSPLIQRKFPGNPDKNQEDPFETENKDLALSFGNSHALESCVNGEDSFSGKYSNGISEKGEPVNYKLAESYKSGGAKATEVKIAFLNNVDSSDGVLLTDYGKRKVEKTASSPDTSTESIPAPAPRRTSFPSAISWQNEQHETRSSKIETGPGSFFYSPLTPRTSTESLRSRASSVDTIVEKPPGFQNDYEYADDRSRKPDSTSTRKRNGSGSLLDSLDESVDSVVEKTQDLYYRLQGSADPGRNKTLNDSVANKNRRSVSVNDIRKAFEKVEVTSTSNVKTSYNNRVASSVPSALSASYGANGNHVRVSSLDSTTSEDSCALTPNHYGSSSNLHREQFGSITSLASSTSLISPQELQLLIEEANQTLEESGGTGGGSSALSHDVLVVILHRDTAGGSVGITLAGGADYESKEITVHKVLAGSPADRDGRIQKGDRILSINGKSMKGATHRESLAILKSPRPEVVLVISRVKSEINGESVSTDDSLVTSLRSSLNGGSNRPPRIVEGTMLNDLAESNGQDVARGPPITLVLVKDGAGLGFSLEGGKDSPLGDKPLVIKKIFTGGAAEKSGQLRAGDELLNLNGIDVVPMSRIEAWKLMKRIPDGNVAITFRRQVENRSVV